MTLSDNIRHTTVCSVTENAIRVLIQDLWNRSPKNEHLHLVLSAYTQSCHRKKIIHMILIRMHILNLNMIINVTYDIYYMYSGILDSDWLVTFMRTTSFTVSRCCFLMPV